MRGATKKKAQLDDYLQILKPLLQRGVSLKKACEYSKIPVQTIRDWKKRNKDFESAIVSYSSFPQVVCETKIMDAINEGDIDSAKWLVQRLDKRKYSTSQELTGVDGEALNPTLWDKINKMRANGKNK